MPAGVTSACRASSGMPWFRVACASSSKPMPSARRRSIHRWNHVQPVRATRHCGCDIRHGPPDARVRSVSDMSHQGTARDAIAGRARSGWSWSSGSMAGSGPVVRAVAAEAGDDRRRRRGRPRDGTRRVRAPTAPVASPTGAADHRRCHRLGTRAWRVRVRGGRSGDRRRRPSGRGSQRSRSQRS